MNGWMEFGRRELQIRSARAIAGFEARQILQWLLKAIIAITTARRCPMLACGKVDVARIK
jgi:hypothetical protein